MKDDDAAVKPDDTELEDEALSRVSGGIHVPNLNVGGTTRGSGFDEGQPPRPQPEPPDPPDPLGGLRLGK